MKTLLIFLILGFAFFFLFKKNGGAFGQNMISNTKNDFYSLDDGNQNELLVSIEISKKWLDSLKNVYDWNEFDEYDNRMWEYMYKLFDETVEKSGIQDNDKLWEQLSRPQKVFWAFLAFNGDTDNGGVDQFVYNRPKFIYAVLETWEELKIQELKTDYDVILNELKKRNNNKGMLKSALKLEEYYYDKEYKRIIHKIVSDYIESNIEMFAIIK